MRITNSMMMNNSRTNVNQNKISMDKLSTQMATQKKIEKPSDDPIVAVRSLRLRNNLSEITQYYEKNIPDAESWLEMTETSMANMRDILQDMYYAFTQGANGDLSTTERGAILENLEALTKEFYDEGNASYAGRTIFTGYKTNSDYTFKEADASASFNIDETFTVGDITSNTYISNNVTVDKTNPTVVDLTDMPGSNTVYSYSMTYSGMPEIQSLSYTDAAGNSVAIPVTVVSASSDTVDSSYLSPAALGVNYIKETGELVFGESIYQTLEEMESRTSLVVNYNKTGFLAGEVRPELYYQCTDLNTNVLYTKEPQTIEYQVGFNQSVKVNTEASDLLDLGVRKEISKLSNAVENVKDAEEKLATLESMLEDERYNDTQKVAIQTMYDATEKELDLKRDKMQKLFEAGVGSFQAYQDGVNLQITNEGNRSARLKLITTRMLQQKTNFKELLTTNEDRELSDVILDYTASTTAYQASLQATGSISKLSLLNYL